jgi:hypothetical protein
VRPISQPVKPPIAAPRPNSVTARAGFRFNFEAVPYAVCFAVDLTALRANFALIDMELMYPVRPGANRNRPRNLRIPNSRDDRRGV